MLVHSVNSMEGSGDIASLILNAVDLPPMEEPSGIYLNFVGLFSLHSINKSNDII